WSNLEPGNISASKLLDFMLTESGNRLATNLFLNSTDRNTILHGESLHPSSLKKSLPISQFDRIRRICSSDEGFQAQSGDLENRFIQQYKLDWITQACERFSGLSQTDCLYYMKLKKRDNNINCVVQYSPFSRDLQTIIQKHWYIISSDPTLTCFNTPPRIVYKRPPNLRNLLVRACLSGIGTIDISVSIRTSLLPTPKFSHFLNSIPSGNYHCGHCTQCNFTHKTKTPLKTRISEHPSHTVFTLHYCGIETIKLHRWGGDVNTLLLKRQAYWIYTLHTLAPHGLNEDIDLRPFL
uniref:Helix-turn-helix domain-containing protein n=1 Tax=Amphilophus citrinellus TaxID=61819 RepID=A0A3Q0RSG0_AMPCI